MSLYVIANGKTYEVPREVESGGKSGKIAAWVAEQVKKDEPPKPSKKAAPTEEAG